MTIRNLDCLLRPTSVVLVGASARSGTLGGALLDNVLSHAFEGSVFVVNPHKVERQGCKWVKTIADLPAAPELAIVMTPAETVPDIIDELGRAGTKCAVVISGGISAASGLRQRMLESAHPHMLRIVGPNCLGIAAPHAKLDSTFARTPARAGKLALISQSGALVTAVLDWADSRGVGFSGVISAGDMADVDLGDLLDLFAVDPTTDAILLYVEGITNAEKFMSAARAAARRKPVIAIKAGKSPAAAHATLSHTGALAGAYDVYRTAFDRAGIVVVDTLTELFDAAEILCLAMTARGNRLGMVTNGGGAGILAVDALDGAKAELSPIASETIRSLDACLPHTWSGGNPVDIIGDAGPERYRMALKAMMSDPTVDGLLVMNCPTAQNDPPSIANAVAEEVSSARAAGIDKPAIACWLGDSNAGSVRRIMLDAAIPVYTSPNDAVAGFGYLLAAQRARQMLIERPAESGTVFADPDAAKAIIAKVRSHGRTVMTEIEAKGLLSTFGIPTVATVFAETAEAVLTACAELSAPFALKIVSPEITHKSDAGGVALDLPDGKAAWRTAVDMKSRIEREHPDARIMGFAVEEMAVRSHGRELIAGIATDPTFGPLLLIGTGGVAVEIVDDKALALPPIDHAQARDLIGETRISKLLAGFRNEPPADVEAVAAVLDALSAMIVSLPDIAELDINPLVVDANGVLTLDARVRICAEPQTTSRLVIKPAPVNWAADLRTRGALDIFVRPVLSDDGPLLTEFFARISDKDRPNVPNRGNAAQIAEMTHADYRRTIAFIVFDSQRTEVLAVASLETNPDRTSARMSMTIRSDLKAAGLRETLAEHLIRYAKSERIGSVDMMPDDRLPGESELPSVELSGIPNI
jgi:acetyltransferase